MLKLDSRDYALAWPLLKEVKINTLFAQGVLGRADDRQCVCGFCT